MGIWEKFKTYMDAPEPDYEEDEDLDEEEQEEEMQIKPKKEPAKNAVRFSSIHILRRILWFAPIAEHI